MKYLKVLWYYYNNSMQKWKDLLVLSVDGSKSTVPDTAENKEVFAITNVIATKKNGEFKLSNYIFESTKNWKSTDTSNIIYIYIDKHIF